MYIYFRLRQEFDDISKQTMTAFRQLPVGYRSSHQVAANSKMSPGVDELDRSIGQVIHYFIFICKDQKSVGTTLSQMSFNSKILKIFNKY